MTLLKSICRSRTLVMFVLLLFQVIASFAPLAISNFSLPENTDSSFVPSIFETDESTHSALSPILSQLQSFQTPSILFIVGDDSELDITNDIPFYNFMTNNLSYSVVYHTANDSYDYTEFDAIVLSLSVADESMITTLGSASIPILTMGPNHIGEFSLGTGYWPITSYTSWTLDSTSHYILDDVQSNNIQIYDPKATFNYLMGFGSNFPVGCEVQRLATYASPAASKYATFVVLEKGGLGFNLKASAERRVYWGAPVTDNFTPEAWSLWNKTLLWTLYDDNPGNATINVHTHDIFGNNISDAIVEIINSNNLSISWSANTSQSGLVSFTNIPWGEYNIKAKYETEENNSLSNLQIAPPRTYLDIYSFDFTVVINFSVDEEAPIIDSVIFNYHTSTFFAQVTDENPLKYVYLNLTAKNTYNNTIIIPLDYFTMIEGLENIYYNATSLDPLCGATINITVTYNIIAEDIIGNYFSTPIEYIDLDDPEPPEILSYEAQDYGNGTVVFSANVTDENDVQAPVILEITGDIYPKTHYDMFQDESGLWTFSGMFEYDVFLNYTIYSANDTVGNNNGYSTSPLLFPYKNVTTIDITAPRISALSSSFDQHDEGYVFFRVEVDDWSIYQSGVNISNTSITLNINGVEETYFMEYLGGIRFGFEKNFEYNDNVTYRVQAYDNANNSKLSSLQGPYRIDDNVIPSVSFSANEYGNGTINFFADVLDWPNNDTTAQVFFTGDYSEVNWTNLPMIRLNSTSFRYSLVDFPYQVQSIWYYVNALDSENNLYEASKDNALSLQLTDLIKPIITLSYSNSSTIDGEISITAQAIDPYGPVYILNNSITINISSIQGELSTNMTFYEGTTYIFTTCYPNQAELNIITYVSDNSGNVGVKVITIRVEDNAPPTILQYGIESFFNSSLTIYSEVIEGPNGSGLLDDNTSITLIYVYRTEFIEIMTWNGTGNFFYFSIGGLNPNDAVFYRLSVVDKANNSFTTDWRQYSIDDTIAPKIIDFNVTETQKDHISTELLFWTLSHDEFGDISEVILNYSILTTEGWINYSYQMNYLGSDYYEKRIIVLPNTTIRYQIIVTDTFNNYNITELTNITTAGFNRALFGVGGYSYDNNNLGFISIWITVNDSFGEHLHNVTITVIDLNTTTTIINEEQLNSGGLNYSISVEITYLHHYSYSFVLVDEGVLHGYYDAEIRNSTIMKIEDNWSPIIHSVGITKTGDSTFVFWANITDWGSGEDPNTLDVFLNYTLEKVTGGGSTVRDTYNQRRMEFNGSFFLVTITFSESGTVKWFVFSSDAFTMSEVYDGASFPFIIGGMASGPGFEDIIAIVVFTGLAFLLIMSSAISIRRRQRGQHERKQGFVEKLDFLTDIYTIMVSSSVGVPIWTVTNVLYKSDETMNGNLSGLSVGIDSFLESFQSDFLTQVQGSLAQSSAQIDGNFKLSLIEQNKVQILILGSTSYRIFVFLKEKPSQFIRETFLTIIKEMEAKAPLRDFGIIDEDLQGPLVKTIIDKYLPVGLLETFKIDLDRLSDIDDNIEIIKFSGMTKAGINILKILSISNLVPLSSKKLNKQSLLKIYKQHTKSNSQLYSGALIYKDALKILNRLGKFSPDELYEAFWIGVDEKVKILVPRSAN